MAYIPSIYRAGSCYNLHQKASAGCPFALYIET